MSTGFPDWTTEQALASLIAGGSVSFTPGGVPLLHGYDTVQGPNATTAIPANSAAFSGGNFAKPGYYISVSVTVANAGATIPFCAIQLLWQDASATVTLHQETWVIPATSSGTHLVMGAGPVRGPHLSLKFTNLDPAFAMTATYTILETTQAQTRDDWRGLSGGTVPGFTQPSQFIETGELIAVNAQAIGAATTVKVLLPLYCGTVYSAFLAGPGQTLDFAVNVVPALSGVFGFGGGTTVFNATEAGSTQTLGFARIPMLLTVTSTNATTWSAYITFLEVGS